MGPEPPIVRMVVKPAFNQEDEAVAWLAALEIRYVVCTEAKFESVRDLQKS